MGTIDPITAISMVRTSSVIAFDTETNGLDYSSQVVGYVITDNERSLYVPTGHEPGGNIPNVDEFEAELAAAFRDRSRMGLRTVGHNLGFDLRMAGKRGVILWSPLEDTMINESLIDDRTIGYGLDDCAARHGVAIKKGHELYVAMAERFGGLPDRNQMKNFWRMPGDHSLVVEYAIGDGISTLELWAAQQKLLDAEELRVPWKLECDLLPYLARMHLRGMKIDDQYSAYVLSEVEGSIAKAKEVFAPGFNVRSPTEVYELYRANGHTEFDTTDTGKPSFTEKWLETNEIGRAILAVRRLEKARDSFITPLIDTHNFGGRIHPTLNQSKSDDYGVIGARLSCAAPNLQAFPKRNKQVGRVVRPLVVPDSGMVIEEADFKQQEPRLFAYFSGDERLLEGYRSGTLDIHDIASADFGLERDIAKRLGLGMLTGMQPKALAGHMRWDINKARAAYNKFLTEAFPAIGIFQRKAKAVFESRGYVKSVLGRRARLDSPRFAYKAVSRIIQNSGGDHMKTALLRANQYEDAHPNSVQILFTIHDSNLWQRDPAHDVSELIKVIENVVNEPQFDLGVPIPVELGSGKNWAEASYGK